MTNSADPDQLASSEANWSGSTLFAKAGHVQVQQDYNNGETQERSRSRSTTLLYKAPDKGLITWHDHTKQHFV